MKGNPSDRNGALQLLCLSFGPAQIGRPQSGSGNLDPDRDLQEEREVSTTEQDSISQPWISNRGRGVCGLSPSSSHAGVSPASTPFPKPET